MKSDIVKSEEEEKQPEPEVPPSWFVCALARSRPDRCSLSLTLVCLWQLDMTESSDGDFPQPEFEFMCSQTCSSQLPWKAPYSLEIYGLWSEKESEGKLPEWEKSFLPCFVLNAWCSLFVFPWMKLSYFLCWMLLKCKGLIAINIIIIFFSLIDCKFTNKVWMKKL